MSSGHTKVFSPEKVSLYPDKVADYLAGRKIYPTTMELDLTQLCSRACSGCPYSVSRRAGLTLQLPFLDRLFSVVGPHTPGIVFSGGESTIVPHFPEALALARAKGFREIAVISNGANLHVPKVQDALMQHATSIRISLYDWHDRAAEPFVAVLRKIETFRERIRKEGSRLEIGASILTRQEWNHRYSPVGLQALGSGIHWLYFHPYCIDWDRERPVQADQTGVLDAISRLAQAAGEEANIQVPYERYSRKPLSFEQLHGAYFLIQVGADGVNYAGPENKYEEDAVLLDLNEYLEDDFFWHPQRVSRINAISSSSYRFIGTKHRPPMFSDYIQGLLRLQDSSAPLRQAAAEEFSYPSII